MLLSAITIIFLIAYALLIGYYYKWWKQLDEFEEDGSVECAKISVIVPARNEAATIAKLLVSLQNQSYPVDAFEVLVVDDHSTDHTIDVVNASALNNLRLIQPLAEADQSSKKKAIEAGVRQASGELIVTTDADCIAPANWLHTINNFYQKTGACFIAAPVKFSHDKSFLGIFQSLDFITLQGITAASVAAHFHTMCNGANLAYTKKAFEVVDGFEGIDKIATGDDMLLMHKIWKNNPSKVFYLKNKDAVVTTPPMPTWKAFFSQRKRWASKTLVYDDVRIIAVLGFVYLLNLLFIILTVAAFFNFFYWIDVIGFLLIKTIIEAPFVYSVAKFYDEEKLMKYFFFFQPVHILYTVSIGFISQFGKYEWKGRKTK